MDWARDNTALSNADLENVFKYEAKPTTVVRMLSRDEVGVCTSDVSNTYSQQKPIVWSLDGDEEWRSWLQHVSKRALKPWFPFQFQRLNLNSRSDHGLIQARLALY